MKANHLIFLVSLAVLGLISCQKTTSAKEEVKVASKEVEANRSGTTTKFASLPKDDFILLIQKCDYIDVIFNDVDVSMNQSNDADVKALLSTIVQGDIELPVCSESAYINFQSNGEILKEGTLYLRGKCRYIVWLEDGQSRYGNKINDTGMTLFRRVLSAGKSTVHQ